MIKVVRKNGETADAMIKRFKNKCRHSGLMGEIRSRCEYTKPSDRRRAKRNAALRRKSKK